MPDITVISASYDHSVGMIAIQLSTGEKLLLEPRVIEGLQDATPEQLAQVRISTDGNRLHWDDLRVFHFAAWLRDGVYGSQQWMALLTGQFPSVDKPE